MAFTHCKYMAIQWERNVFQKLRLTCGNIWIHWKICTCVWMVSLKFNQDPLVTLPCADSWTSGKINWLRSEEVCLKDLNLWKIWGWITMTSGSLKQTHSVLCGGARNLMWVTMSWPKSEGTCGKAWIVWKSWGFSSTPSLKYSQVASITSQRLSSSQSMLLSCSQWRKTCLTAMNIWNQMVTLSECSWMWEETHSTVTEGCVGFSRQMKKDGSSWTLTKLQNVSTTHRLYGKMSTWGADFKSKLVVLS